MSDNTLEYRSVIETSTSSTINILFAAVLFVLLIGILGTVFVDTSSLSTLVAGILLMISFTITMIFRQVIMEVTQTEIALSWGTEKVWIARDKISSVEIFEMTAGRRLSKTLSLGPWSASGKEKIHYFGAKTPMVLICTTDSRSYAVSVDNAEKVLDLLS
ncbi:MAG: hypothetical protein JW738_10350 [Actinobacteria bacterium]|nr:hypothetical protein [Actinomycetota bacterium]